MGADRLPLRRPGQTSGARYLYLLAGFFLLLQSCTADTDKAKSFKAVFDHYREREGVTAISFPPGLVGLFLSDSDPDQAELKSLMQELTTFRMLSVSDSSGDTGTAGEMSAAVADFTTRNEFQDLFRIQTGGEDIFIRVLEKEGIISEAIVMLNADDTFFVIDLRGNIAMEHFTRLAQEGYLEGLTGLGDINL
jgi:hypothetical protein